MSSLRLALKQSLQEAGPLKQKQSRANRKKRNDGSLKRKKHNNSSSNNNNNNNNNSSGNNKPGESPRKRGRPFKGSRQRNDSDDDDDDRDHDDDRYAGHSSSDENEFSAGEEEEEEEEDDDEDDDDDEEESETQSHNDEDDKPHQSSGQQQQQPKKGERDAAALGSGALDRNRSDDEEADDESDQDQRRHQQQQQQRKLQKKLKHTAANKIQNQWKKKKSSDSNTAEDADAKPTETALSAPETSNARAAGEPNESQSSHKGEWNDRTKDQEGTQKKKKKGKGNVNERGAGKGKTAKTVPPPTPDVLEWNRTLPIKRARRNVVQGLRVKVRFATKVKRDGKIVRKKKWFGGRVSAVSKEGSKIRIKYDDGTAEISKFPDKDVVVDDAFNGEHHANASKFQPPEPEPDPSEHVEEEENDEPIEEDDTKTLQKTEHSEKAATLERKPSPVSQGIAAVDKVENPVKAKSPPVPPMSSPATLPDEGNKTQEPSEPQRSSPKVEKKGKNLRTSPKTSPATSPPQVKEIIEAPMEMDIPSPPVVFKTQVTMVGPSVVVAGASSSSPPSPGEIAGAANTSGSSVQGDLSSGKNVSASEEQILENEDPKSEPELQPDDQSPSEGAATRENTHNSTPVEEPSTNDGFKRNNEGSNSSASSSEKGEEESAVPAANAEFRPIEKPPSRPTLTIRIPNLTKERRGSLTEGRSPRIKLSSRPVVRESTGEKPEPTVTATASAPSLVLRMSPRQEDMEKSVIAAGSKRQRVDDEAESGEEEAAAPPSKRIHIHRPPVVAEEAKPLVNPPHAKNEVDISNKGAQENRPSSRQSDRENKVNAPHSKGMAADDADDGPVKIAGRSSAKRVPLFSDEEEDAITEKPKAVKRKTSTNNEDTKPSALDCYSNKDGMESQHPMPTEATANEAATVGHSDFESSENSAFERKSSNSSKKSVERKEADQLKLLSTVAEIAGTSEMNGPVRPSTPRDKALGTSITPVVRSGRRAAQQANERIVSTKQEGDKEKDKEKEREPSAAGKKRKKRDKNDEDSESSNEDDNNWVQCDKCRKWRIIPNTIRISSLPDRWYCHMNIYDPKRNTCEAPEQTARTTPVVKMKKKRGRKKIRQRAAEAMEPSNSEEPQMLGRRDSSQSDTAKEKTRVRSPLPREDTKSTKEVLPNAGSATPKPPKPPRASPNSISVAAADSSSVPEAENEPQPSKKSKPEKKTKRLPDAPLESIPEAAPGENKVKRSRAGRSRKEKDTKEIKDSSKDQEHEQVGGTVVESTSSRPSLPTEQQDADNVEWVQCEKCEKWRKLASNISADELPDVWYCSMNTWNVASASCDAPEDKADGQQDLSYGPSHDRSGKLSYRNLIFGSGKKVNRPVSERTRAAESIFATPSEDSECAYPTVMYASSSAFAPRGSRANIIEEESSSFSVFDLMQHSNLWAELRGSSEPFNPNSVESAGFGKPFLPKYSYKTLPSHIKQDLRDMILCALSNKILLGEEVLLECQCRHWDNAPPSWSDARSYCTKDIVITLLCELVTEGKLQLVQAFGTDWTVKDWNPRYRRTSTGMNENTAPPAPKSRCMKIAKPWKQKVV